MDDFEDVYSAMDTYDMVKIVIAHFDSLKKSGSLAMVPTSKSKVKSATCREAGNDHYKSGRNRLAIVLYNKSLAYAPKNSEEMILALGNRSAIFFNLRHYTACIKDIYYCQAMKCNRDLSKRLNKRKKAILSMPEKNEDFFAKINGEKSCLDQNFPRNVDVPCASTDVSFIQDGVKRITAANDIQCGSLVAVEKAYTICSMNDEDVYLSCYHCNKITPSLIPCEGCYGAMFCSERCQEDSMKQYHRVECHIMDSMEPYYKTVCIKLVIRTVIKLSLKTGWERFVAAARDVGTSRFKMASVKETYDSREPLSILSYNEINDPVVEGKIFNGGMFCASAIYWLSTVAGYFPKKASKFQSAKDAMAYMMMHLYLTFNRKIRTLSSAYDLNGKSFVCGAQNNYGWFSMTSKLNHSCEPNLLVLGLNDSVGLVALRTIKAGEELTISFIEYFYDMRNDNKLIRGRFRSNILYVMTRIMCNCRLCSDDNDDLIMYDIRDTDEERESMAKLQHLSYKAICKTLDISLFGTMEHRVAYNTMMKDLCKAQYKCTQNITCL